jgi:hypothetical protein
MKKLFFSLLVIGFLTSALTISVQAFNMTIAPAKKVFEMNRGETKDYTIVFRNDFDAAQYQVKVVDFVYNESGVRNFVEQDELADPNQSMTTWVQLGVDRFEADKGVDNKIPVRISIPENAAYGDHFGVVLIEKFVESTDGGTGPVTVGGSIASVLALKVLGGKSIKAGGLVDFQVTSQERARNTVNFDVKFNNTGNEFFSVLAEIEVFESADDEKPVKSLSRDFTIFPNVVREVKIPLGDLGDDFGEKEYIARLSVYEFDKGKKISQMARAEKPFQYFIPVSTDAEIHYVAKEVEVAPDVVQIVKELGLYIGGFILLLIVLIRVLFFHKTQQVAVAAPKRSRKK